MVLFGSWHIAVNHLTVLFDWLILGRYTSRNHLKSIVVSSGIRGVRVSYFIWGAIIHRLLLVAGKENKIYKDLQCALRTGNHPSTAKY